MLMSYRRPAFLASRLPPKWPSALLAGTSKSGGIMTRAVIALVVGAVSISGCTPGDSVTGSETMVNHFASSCRSSVGNWTNSALSQTQSLIATLETVKDRQEKDCAGLTQALQATRQIQQRLQLMSQDPTLNAYRLAEERKLEILLALGRTNGSTDPDLIAQLRTELYSTELHIVRTRAEASASSKDRERNELLNGLGDLNQYVLSLVSQGNLSACLAATPHMPLGIATSLLAIGGNFSTPLVGTGMAAIGNLMSTTVNYARQMPLEQAQLDLESPRMQTALTCSLEAISDLYCDAESSFEFMQFALNSYGKRGEIDGVWRGMDLLGRRVPVLNRWLLKVASGVDPSDRHSAARLNAVWTRQAKLREISNFVVGELNQTKRLLTGVSSAAEIDLRTKSGFKRIIDQMYPSSHSPGSTDDINPIDGFLSKINAICRLSANSNCKRPDGFFDFDDVIDQYGIDGGFAAFESRVKALLDEVFLLVSKELLDTINQDPESLVAEATQASLGQWSVLKTLRELQAFSSSYAAALRLVPTSQMPGRDRAIAVVEDTERAFDEIAGEIETGASAVDVINKVFSRLKLLDGLQFVNQRVTQMVSWELENRVRQGELPGALSADLIGAGLSLVEQLDRAGINVQRDADAIASDLRNAQYIARENLRLTAETFAPTIAQILTKMRQSALEAGETDPSDPANRRLAQMCILLLTTSQKWPAEVDANLCAGTQLVSVYKDSGLALNFDSLRSRVVGPNPIAFKDRVCVYSNFLRSARLFRAGQQQPGAMRTRVSLEKHTIGLIPVSWRDLYHQIVGAGPSDNDE